MKNEMVSIDDIMSQFFHPKLENLLHVLLELSEVKVLAQGMSTLLQLVELQEKPHVALALVYRFEGREVLQSLWGEKKS